MFVVMFMAVLLFPSVASAALCNLWWNPSTFTNVAGYAVYTSLVSGQYGQPSWIGDVTFTTCEQLGLTTDGKTHYFIVKVYTTNNVFSPPSNQVSKLLAAVTPPPTPRVCLKYNPRGKCLKWSN